MPRQPDDEQRGPPDSLPVGPPLLLRLRDAAEVLGISERSLRRLIERRELPTVMVGGCRRVKTSDLQRYVDTLP